PSPGLTDPPRAPAGCPAIPAQEVGGHLEENAPAVGQPRDAQVITESGRQSRVAPHGRVRIDRFSACLPTPPIRRGVDLAAASLSFLPGIGSSNSRCPSIRLLAFFD